jgi:hypothetical protein
VSEQDEEAEPVEPHLAAAIIDVFVYVVVLNLFVEYLPVVISETFTLSLLTALLLKGVLEVVLIAKKRVVTTFRQASTPVGKVVAAILVWAVLFGSKFAVLESVALVFGPRVSLGGFFSVTALIVILMLSRAGSAGCSSAAVPRRRRQPLRSSRTFTTSSTSARTASSPASTRCQLDSSARISPATARIHSVSAPSTVANANTRRRPIASTTANPPRKVRNPTSTGTVGCTSNPPSPRTSTGVLTAAYERHNDHVRPSAAYGTCGWRRCASGRAGSRGPAR